MGAHLFPWCGRPVLAERPTRLHFAARFDAQLCVGLVQGKEHPPVAIHVFPFVQALRLGAHVQGRPQHGLRGRLARQQMGLVLRGTHRRGVVVGRGVRDVQAHAL